MEKLKLNETMRGSGNNDPDPVTIKTPIPAQRQPYRNPRLVYGDPDSFFRDLVMEQQEQG